MKSRTIDWNDKINPIRYDIEIEPNLHSFVFKGKVDINVEIKRKTDKIILNAKELKIKSVSSTFDDEIGGKVTEFKDQEEMEILLKRKVKGKGVIHIVYEGLHNDNIYGFCRNVYTKNGKREYMVATRLEPTGARAVFPCFDSPSFKAAFNVTLIVDKGFEALSNMPVKGKKTSRKKISVTFEQTPMMPTYLLFMAVGRFKYVEERIGKHHIRAVTAHGKTRKTGLALGYAREIIEFYENYLGVQYPFPKLDMVAIPGYGRNTMEHLGAVSFGEIDMLADSDSLPELKLEIKRTIAHEFAHQWFGNLVSVNDWGDIWLSEGVATFMSSKALKENLTETVQESLEADASTYTHPLSLKSKSNDDPHLLFDYITYVKGAAVLVMLESLMGSKRFRKGLHRYLRAFANKGATTESFSESMGSAMPRAKASRAVKLFINQWATEQGYPLVKVSMVTKKIVLKQSLFTLSSDKGMKDPRLIPLDFITGNKKGHVLMASRTMRMNTGNTWIKVNHGQKALCRVEYSIAILEELGRVMSQGGLTPEDSNGLLNDLFTFARSGRIGLDAVLTFIEKYCQHAGLQLNILILKHLDWIYSMVRGGPIISNRVMDMIISRSRQVLSETTLRPKADENITITQSRNIAFDSLGFADDHEEVSMARDMFNSALTQGKKIDSSLKPYIYKVVARNSGKRVYENLVKMRKKATLDEDEYILAALASFTDAAVLPIALDYLISDDVPNSTHLIHLAASTPANCSKIVWPWMKRRWKRISKKYNSVSLEEILMSLERVADASTKSDIMTFFREHDVSGLGVEGALKRTLETISSNIRFMHKNSRL